MTRSRNGFTLIELMVAMGIGIIIIASMASVFKISSAMISKTLRQVFFYSRVAAANYQIEEDAYKDHELDWITKQDDPRVPIFDVVLSEDPRVIVFPAGSISPYNQNRCSGDDKGSLRSVCYTISGYVELSKEDIVEHNPYHRYVESARIPFQMFFLTKSTPVRW